MQNRRKAVNQDEIRTNAKSSIIEAINRYFEQLNELPPIVLITVEEYRQLELELGYIISMAHSYQTRKRRPLGYTIEGHTVKVIVKQDFEWTFGMNEVGRA